MKLETLLPLGKVDPGLREPGTPFDIHTVGEQAQLVESLGYDAVMFEETKHDPFMVMALAAAATLFLSSGGAGAADVTIGYQLVYGPWKANMEKLKKEGLGGKRIEFVKFNSGTEVINAMASGDVHIALAGSSPIAAGVSRGLDIELFWIVEDIASAEALVVRDGSGIIAPGLPQDTQPGMSCTHEPRFQSQELYVHQVFR